MRVLITAAIRNTRGQEPSFRFFPVRPHSPRFRFSRSSFLPAAEPPRNGPAGKKNATRRVEKGGQVAAEIFPRVKVRWQLKIFDPPFIARLIQPPFRQLTPRIRRAFIEGELGNY